MRNWGLSVLAALTAFLLVMAPASFAKKSIGDISSEPTALSAKYRLADGGYLVFAVDDNGRAEGYYLRDGRFGQVFGTVEDSVLNGYWAEADGVVQCETTKRGTSAWGRVELRFDDLGEFRGLTGACEQEPNRLMGGKR